MNGTFKLQCPACKCILEISDYHGSDQVVIQCPSCKTRNKMCDFIKNPVVQPKPAPKAPDCATQLAFGGSGSDAGRTQYLMDLRSGARFTLSMGRNLVGRRATSSVSVADIQIDTKDMGVSRSHFYVELHCMDDGKIKAVLSNAKNKNTTFVNNELIEGEDKIVLHNRDLIKISQTELKYFNE